MSENIEKCRKNVRNYQKMPQKCRKMLEKRRKTVEKRRKTVEKPTTNRRFSSEVVHRFYPLALATEDCGESSRAEAAALVLFLLDHQTFIYQSCNYFAENGPGLIRKQEDITHYNKMTEKNTISKTAKTTRQDFIKMLLISPTELDI
jgi:hypothetical protein